MYRSINAARMTSASELICWSPNIGLFPWKFPEIPRRAAGGPPRAGLFPWKFPEMWNVRTLAYFQKNFRKFASSPREYETYSPTSTGSRSIVHFTAGLGSLNGSQLGPSAPSTRSIGVSEKPRTFRDVPRRVRGTIRSGFDPENRVRSCPSCSGPTCLASGQLSCVAPGRPLQHFRLVHSGATRLQSSMPFGEWDDPCAGGPQLS